MSTSASGRLASAVAGDWPSAVFALAGTATTGTVVAVALRGGRPSLTVLDRVCTALIVPGLAGWLLLDVPAMLELTKLTNPGPFLARTHELGTFLGIRVDGQLVAMAGERMKPANYTEITAVCVRPDYRGRRYAQLLLGAVARQIVARGEIPFLHVFSDNDSAIALYRRQGMEIRRRISVTVLGRNV